MHLQLLGISDLSTFLSCDINTQGCYCCSACLHVLAQLLRAGPNSPLHPVPLWARPGLAGGRCCDAALVREFRQEARVVREGMEGDLIKVGCLFIGSV